MRCLKKKSGIVREEKTREKKNNRSNRVTINMILTSQYRSRDVWYNFSVCVTTGIAVTKRGASEGYAMNFSLNFSKSSTYCHNFTK